jgi:hypothetical protein
MKYKSVFLIWASLTSVAQAQTPLTIFGNGAPQTPLVADPNAVTLGVKFFSTVAGTISGISFYRDHKNSSGYTVKLFTNGGSLLASARVAKDTCVIPCWESVNFALPISVSNNTTYIAAYYTSNGEYADDSYGLTNGAGSGPLYAQATGGSLGGNGVYTYSTGFPNQTWENSNYWVDVLFTATAPTLMFSVNPTAPQVASSSPVGTVVATLLATWSDGSTFTGTYGFSPPYNDDGGAFAISGNSLIVAQDLSSDVNTTQNVTVSATQ